MKTLFLLLLLTTTAWAQTKHTFPALDTNNVWTGQNNLPESYTVAALPVAPPSGVTAIVTDGTGISCTTGGGSNLVLCRYNGSVWQVVGGATVISATDGQVLYSIGGVATGVTGLTFRASTLTAASSLSVDFSGALATLPAQKGTVAALPLTCTVGQLYFASDATPGQNLYGCSSTNTWTVVASGAGGGTITGTGVAFQLPYWTGGTTLGSDADFIYTPGSHVHAFGVGGIKLPGSSGSVTLKSSGAVTSYTLNFPTAVGAGFVRSDGSGNLSYAELSGDCTTSLSGVVTCLKTNGVLFATSATVDTTNASNISSGTFSHALLDTSSIGVNGVTLALGDAADFISSLYDVQGHPELQATSVTNAINFLCITGAADANPATVQISICPGGSANANLNFVSTGTGLVLCNGVSCGGAAPGGVGGSTKQYQINNGGSVAGSSTLSNSLASGAGTVLAIPVSDVIPQASGCFAGGAQDCFQVYGQAAMSVPSPATLSTSAGGSLGGITAFAKVTCVDPLGGETTISSEAGPQTVLASNLLVITPPTSTPTGCVGWRPYATSGASNSETLQVVSGNCTLATGTTLASCAIGAAWTEPSATGLASGAAVPGSNTARIKNFWIDASGAMNFTGNQMSLGSAVSVAAGSLSVHGGNTNALPGYLALFNNADNLVAYLSASNTAGRFMMSSTTPTTDDPTKYLITAGTIDSLSGKTVDTASGNTIKFNGVSVTGTSGTGATVALNAGATLTVPIVSDHLILTEGASPAGTTGQDWLFGNSTSHRAGVCNQTSCDFFSTPSSTDADTNKTFDTAATGNVFKINGTSITSISGNTAKVATAATALTGAAGTLACVDGSGNVTTTACNAGVGVTWNAITAASGNMSIANAGFTSTFNQTSGVNWTWANTTAATSLISQSSPIFNLSGKYWNGASATDNWTSQNVVSNTINAASTFTFAHTGTSGLASVQLPVLNLPEGTAPTGSSGADLLYGISASHRVGMALNGTADLVVGAATTDTLTNKTYDTAGAGNSFKINGTAITGISGNTATVASAAASVNGATAGTLLCADGSGNATSTSCKAVNVRAIAFTIGDPGGSALTAASTTTAYVTVPFACTISAYNLAIDAGTITVKFWKIATGTAIPTSANSINTSGVGISSGTAIHSTTLSDFTSTAVSANDILAMNVTVTATAKYINGVLECDQ